MTTPVRSPAAPRPRGAGRRPLAAAEAGAAAAPLVAGLAASQIRRMRRIVDAAVHLAEQGGFEGVRLRDVAEASDVALGTLYKYFRSKEDILLFALAEEMERLETAIVARPIQAGTRLDRVVAFFARATTGLTRRPHFARAVLRSISAGDSDMAVKVAGFMLRMTRLIVAAQRGEVPDLSAPVDATLGTERERQIAFVLTHFWFSSLSGWAGGLHSARTVSDQLRIAAALLIEEE
ncbi:MAG TPA: TetR family transcriptional regulator [Myxococcota bacterium]|nr:TetR family transcriptional regulator [Myxococcota bacterium]